jgi:TetR/AcrR family transcriptional repressor of nem operon
MDWTVQSLLAGNYGPMGPIPRIVIVMHGVADRRSEPVLTSRGRATRDRIVAAAAGLMHERGVAGTSLDDVRAVTETSKSQLYHYFSDKSALVGAVVDRQVQQVLHAQQPELDAIDSMAGLRRWRDRVVASYQQTTCVGGCPLGRLASELAGSDPTARAALIAGFGAWQDGLVRGLRAMREGGDLADEADPDRLAIGLLAAVQGGLLLAQTAGSVAPLEAALDVALAGIEGHLGRA